MSMDNDTANHRGITDDETDTGGFTIHHLDEAAAERAIDRFKRKAAAGDDGERIGRNGRMYIEDELVRETDDKTMFIIDGEPLDMWLAGKPLDRMEIDTGDE